VVGWPNQRYALLFRDYLRAHPRAADAYARLKRGPAQRLGDDLAAYTDIKDPACDLIVLAAEAWAPVAQSARTAGRWTFVRQQRTTWPTSSRPVTWAPAGAGEGLNQRP
jgi:hypothetical protein